MSTPRGPVLIDLEQTAKDADAPNPATAPPVPEEGATGERAAMQRLAAAVSAKPKNRLATWFWSLLGSVLLFFASLAAWSVVDNLLASNPLLGLAAMVLLGTFALVCLAIVARELMAFARLSRLDKIQHAAARALADGDLGEARKIAIGLADFYADRPELRWSREDFASRLGETFDTDAALGLAENDLLGPLDKQAVAEVEAAARQVAMVTALVPLALADVFAALTSNMRMIRRVAEVYGGRAGTLGTWRLMRAVLTHLVATGAVAVGDDLIGSVAGGSLLTRVSRRFGEGVVNGALTARVGVAAIEVCRPLPFSTRKRPSVTRLVQRALTGLFGDKDQAEGEGK